MKLFHISDLHIGLKLLNRDLVEDQVYILDQIVKLAVDRQPDVVLIAGDIYDKAIPSAEAVEVFDRFISDLTERCPEAEIMMISGNHDSASRIDCFRSILSRQKVHMIGRPPQKEGEYIEKVTLTDDHGPVHFYLLPFVKPSMVKQITGTQENGNNLSYDETLHRLIARENIDRSERNVLVSHQFYLPVGTKAEEIKWAESEIHTVGNIDQVSSDVLEPFDYAALGHIHKPMKVGSEFWRYSGTPIACSVSEAGQEKGIIEVDLGPKGEVQTSVLPLKPLREVRVIEGAFLDVLEQGCGDYVTVILTDKEDLNIIDMQERVRDAFPYLLEIRRQKAGYRSRQISMEEQETLTPYELCLAFLTDLSEREKDILKDVINTVEEGTE